MAHSHKMIRQKQGSYLETSISLGIISIAITALINYQIAKEYLESDGKTRALFGLKEWLQFGYQYYVLIPGIISLILAILSIKVNGQQSKKLTAFITGTVAITIVFVRIWRLFV